MRLGRRLKHVLLLLSKTFYCTETMNRLCAGGDLLSGLNNNGGPFNEDALHTAAQQLFRAVRYLHDRNIVHADLKLDNILLLNNSIEGLRVIDFGLAVNVQTEADQLSRPRGSLNYMAPEMFFPNMTFGYGADTWSLGVIMFILATGSFPFGGANE